MYRRCSSSQAAISSWDKEEAPMPRQAFILPCQLLRVNGTFISYVTALATSNIFPIQFGASSLYRFILPPVQDGLYLSKLSVLRRRASAFLQGAADPRFHAGWRRFPFFGCRTASPRPLSGGLQNVVRGVASIMLRCGASPPWPFPSWRGRSSRASSRCLSAP